MCMFLYLYSTYIYTCTMYVRTYIHAYTCIVYIYVLLPRAHAQGVKKSVCVDLSVVRCPALSSQKLPV